MSLKKCLVWSPIAAIATLWMAGAVSAAPVFIKNHSFEANNLGAGGWADAIVDWSEDVQNSNGSFAEHITGFAADGTHHLGINNINSADPDGFYFVWQDLGVPMEPFTQYTMTVAVGNRNTSFTVPGNTSIYSLEVGGSSVASGSFDASTIPASTFVDAEPITFTTGAVVPAGNIVVKLGNFDPEPNINLGRSHFDNIRLDATRVPEPSSALMVVLGALGLVARRRRAR